MSKRKTNSQTLQTADMTFEDDDIEDQQTDSIAGDSKGSGSRVSARAKKAKAIYDPSEYNGPVHKRKKEAMESQQQQQSKSPIKATKPVEPVQTVIKAIPAITVQVKTVEVPVKPKSPKKRSNLPKSKTVEDDKPSHSKKSDPVPKLAINPAGPLVKEPSKRIQARKQLTVGSNGNASKSAATRKQREESITSTYVSDEYDRASTIEFINTEVPDVRKWTHQQVFDHFSKNLGFSTSDSAVFKDEEIDGEALMIMKRSDIVTTKFQKLKLGTALKMWSQIICFQTGSSDPTQAWK